jgi:hypothetical protein
MEGVHIGARALHVNLYSLAKYLVYPSRKEGGNFFVQMIFICLCPLLHLEEGGGVRPL